ncbi:hypothetical protein ABBQ32_006919 [Trebouxia sp. C0010 RCD-2024]
MGVWPGSSVQLAGSGHVSNHARLISSCRQAKHVRPRNAAAAKCSAAVEAPPVAAAGRVKLGSSDLEVSECCLGSMTWGKQNTEQEAHTQLGYAFDLGVNFLDTAEMYPVPPNADTKGFTDNYIGSWLRSQKRENIVLASKVSGYSDKSWIRGKATRVNPEQIEQSVDDSLQRLKTDHLDLLQIHWPDRYLPLFGSGVYDSKQERENDVPFEEQLKGLERVIKAGKVRHVGVSNETSYGVMRFAQLAEQFNLPRIVSIQNCYNLLARGQFDTDLAEVCAPRQCNVGLLAYSPLAGGALSGKYVDGRADPKARFNMFPGYMARYNKSPAKTAVGAYIELAEKYGLTPTQLALAWLHQRSCVTSTIIGATSAEQLKENIGAFDKELSEECLADIEKLHKQFRDPAMS